MSMHITKEPYSNPATGAWVIGLRRSKVVCLELGGREVERSATVARGQAVSCFRGSVRIVGTYDMTLEVVVGGSEKTRSNLAGILEGSLNVV